MQCNPALSAVLYEVQLLISHILLFLFFSPFPFFQKSARVENEGVIKSLPFLDCVEYSGFVLTFPISLVVSHYILPMESFVFFHLAILCHSFHHFMKLNLLFFTVTCLSCCSCSFPCNFRFIFLQVLLL